MLSLRDVWLFNHKRADFWLPNFGFKRLLLSLLKLPVKRARWFSVYNWQVASCEYKQYCDVVLPPVMPKVFIEKRDVSLRKYNKDDVNYCVMCRLRQYLVK